MVVQSSLSKGTISIALSCYARSKDSVFFVISVVQLRLLVIVEAPAQYLRLRSSTALLPYIQKLRIYLKLILQSLNIS